MLGNTTAAGDWLRTQPGVVQLTSEGSTVRFQFHSTADEKSREVALLLKAMIQQEFEVVDFTTEGKTLEDVFMQITTGAVQ